MLYFYKITSSVIGYIIYEPSSAEIRFKPMAYSIRSNSLLKAPTNLIPLFLCPLLASCTGGYPGPAQRPLRPRRHQLHVDVAAAASHGLHGLPIPSQVLPLPRSCPGCGALTQTISTGQPGYYSTNRKSVKAFTGRNGQNPGNRYDGESEVFEHVLEVADVDLLSQMGLHGASDTKLTGQIS